MHTMALVGENADIYKYLRRISENNNHSLIAENDLTIRDKFDYVNPVWGMLLVWRHRICHHNGRKPIQRP